MGRISLAPVVPESETPLPPQVREALTNKLRLFATSNGLGGVNPRSRFVIAGNLYVTEKNIVPSIPAQVSIKADMVFHIADQETQNIFASTTVSGIGVGGSDFQAYQQIINSVNPTSPGISAWVEKGKKGIIEYYNAQCDFIIARAKNFAVQQEYDAALYVLTSVPEVCKDCYMQASAEIGPIFQKKIDLLCASNLAKAKAAWASNPNQNGANAAAGFLANIFPGAACYIEAQALVESISRKMISDENREWQFVLRQWDDKVSLESQRIEAARAIGVAYGSNQPERISTTYIWLR
ncbi:MAG: hypothetical protein NW241_12580 [Bacteroidia bacterium]|nr:hypothetical protein [Bacteroidia bacterium]